MIYHINSQKSQLRHIPIVNFRDELGEVDSNTDVCQIRRFRPGWFRVPERTLAYNRLPGHDHGAGLSPYVGVLPRW